MKNKWIKMPICRWLTVVLFSLIFKSNVYTQYTCNYCSQADVDAYNSGSFVGSIFVSGSDITNLDAFSEIQTSFSSVVIFSNPLLTDITGLRNLKDAVGSLKILDNPILEKIDLESFQASIELKNNDEVDSLILPSWYLYSLEIQDNESLKYIEASSANGNPVQNIAIVNNPSLEELFFPPEMTTMNSLTISNNPSLTNVDGLRYFSTYNGAINITDNISLNKYCGLWNVVAEDIYFPTNITGNLTNPTNLQILQTGSCGNFIRDLVGYSTLGEALNGIDDYSYIYVARDVELGDPVILPGNKKLTFIIQPSVTMRMDASFTNNAIFINHGSLRFINGNTLTNNGTFAITGEVIFE